MFLSLINPSSILEATTCFPSRVFPNVAISTTLPSIVLRYLPIAILEPKAPKPAPKVPPVTTPIPPANIVLFQLYSLANPAVTSLDCCKASNPIAAPEPITASYLAPLIAPFLRANLLNSFFETVLIPSLIPVLTPALIASLVATPPTPTPTKFIGSATTAGIKSLAH